MNAYPELVSEGYNVLHINPLGYATPDGPADDKLVGGVWPVMPDTAASLGRKGYVDWLSDAILAVRWGLEQECVESGRYAFFGSSQGGGTALLLASVLRERGVRCVAADVPGLINIPSIGAREPCQREALLGPIDRIAAERPSDLPAAWKALGYVDVLGHAHRLTMPVLLTAGDQDTTCPAENIRALFELLCGTRSYTEIEGQAHGYTRHFL